MSFFSVSFDFAVLDLESCLYTAAILHCCLAGKKVPCCKVFRINVVARRLQLAELYNGCTDGGLYYPI